MDSEKSNTEKDKVVHIRAKTLTLHWHEGASAIYSVSTQPNKPGEKSQRLVTGGGDNNIRIWKVKYNETEDDIIGVEYLSSITKHTQAVNCVRFNSTGTLLATASDDGTIMIWERHDKIIREFGQENDEELKESWVMKVACFGSNMSEIYDICWSPDSKFICCGLMDNIIRIFNVSTGSMVKQIAEHSHYVQGVSWDPRGEFICSQSADRSVHVYKVNINENGELNIGPTTFFKSVKSEVPTIKLSQIVNENVKQSEVLESSNDSTNDLSVVNQSMQISNSANSLMEPPMQAPRHKRTYSNSSTSSSHSHINRCSSPLPLPLPAVMPSSPNNHHHNMAISSMVSPSSSSGGFEDNERRKEKAIEEQHPKLEQKLEQKQEQKQEQNLNDRDNEKKKVSNSNKEQLVNFKSNYLYHNETLQSFFRRLTFSPDGSLLITTCGIYKTGDDNHNGSIENTVYVYTRAGLNKGPVVHLPGLRKPALVVRFSPVKYKLIRNGNGEREEINVFKLNYRMLFAIATQDSILIYDTQRLSCVAVITSIHYAVITDITWSSDGKSIFVSSNDGFISCAVLSDGLVGEIDGGLDAEEIDIMKLKSKETEMKFEKDEKNEKDIAVLLGEGVKRRCL